MEYDRALFRVYERIMEDLNASPSPLSMTVSGGDNTSASNASSPRGNSGLRRRHRHQGDSGSPSSASDNSPLAQRESVDQGDANGHVLPSSGQEMT